MIFVLIYDDDEILTAAVIISTILNHYSFD